MLFIFSTPVLIRHLWRFKTVLFLHQCLIRTVLLTVTLLVLMYSPTNITITCQLNDGSVHTKRLQGLFTFGVFLARLLVDDTEAFCGMMVTSSDTFGSMLKTFLSFVTDAKTNMFVFGVHFQTSRIFSSNALSYCVARVFFYWWQKMRAKGTNSRVTKKLSFITWTP
jgi:hypothetical protein